MTTPSQAVRAYLAEIGRKGGQVKVATKGFREPQQAGAKKVEQEGRRGPLGKEEEMKTIDPSSAK